MNNESVGLNSPGKKAFSLVHLLYHLHPVRIPLAALDIKRTFGLGGMGVVLILILAFSGTLMLFVYKPLPQEAYGSALLLQEAYMFGKFVRALHYFSANLLVIITLAHMLRVFFTQCFHAPRQFNWIIGLTLMILILAACFTGYLLPWDQTAYWAVTICLSMFDYLPIPMDLAITSNTLQIFFTLHTTLIPICFLVLLPLHFWKVRKARGIGLPEQGKESDGKPLVSTLPNLVSREITAGLILIALVMMLAAMFQAPLGDMANPGLSPNPAKAPWYFMGFQEMLLHFHPVVPVLLAPLTLLFFFGLIPYIKYPFSHPGIWFISRAGRTTGLISFFASILLTTAMIITDTYGFGDGLPGSGLMSMSLAVGIPAVTLWLTKRYGLCLNEVVQILVIQVVTIYLTLSLIGTLFRGEGMKLSGGFF